MWADVFLYVAIGFVAQMVDGAIGMAYGIVASSVLLSAGVNPATTSACVHVAEVFTTGASGLAHWRLGNIDRRLLIRLVIPGAIGGALGAYVLSHLPGEAIRPFVASYLLVIGLVILYKAVHPPAETTSPPRFILPLGFVGGILDAIGGGGWGPIVTSTLLGRGSVPRTTIGSVNAAEFFVALTVSLTFVLTIGLSLWPILAGLVLGGLIAAPFAALATKHLPDRVLMVMVGGVVILLSLRTIGRAVA